MTLEVNASIVTWFLFYPRFGVPWLRLRRTKDRANNLGTNSNLRLVLGGGLGSVRLTPSRDAPVTGKRGNICCHNFFYLKCYYVKASRQPHNKGIKTTNFFPFFPLWCVIYIYLHIYVYTILSSGPYMYVNCMQILYSFLFPLSSSSLFCRPFELPGATTSVCGPTPERGGRGVSLRTVSWVLFRFFGCFLAKRD